MWQSKREISQECNDIIGSAKESQISEKYWGEVGKGKRVDFYLEVRKRRGQIFFEWNKCLCNWVSERITNKRTILRRSGEGEKGRCLPWCNEEEGAYIFGMKQVPEPWVVVPSCYRFSCYYWFSDIAINSVNPPFIWRLEFSKNG
jgi:hypothetical protein